MPMLKHFMQMRHEAVYISSSELRLGNEGGGGTREEGGEENWKRREGRVEEEGGRMR